MLDGDVVHQAPSLAFEIKIDQSALYTTDKAGFIPRAGVVRLAT